MWIIIFFFHLCSLTLKKENISEESLIEDEPLGENGKSIKPQEPINVVEKNKKKKRWVFWQ